MPGFNFISDVVARFPPERLAVVERTADGRRREHSFGELTARALRLSAELSRLGARRGSVVAIVMGSRIEWIESMLACFAGGYVALACNEQLRAEDLRARFAVAAPAVVVADERDRAVVEAAAPDAPVLLLPDRNAFRAEPAAPVPLSLGDPAIIVFTSGTTGPPRAAVHAVRYLPGQQLQVRNWIAPVPRQLYWCTAATGWSKSARNGFVAAWLGDAPVLLHDARFDPQERLAILAEEGVATLCMAPTEYRLIAARTGLAPLPRLATAVAAGEALDAATLSAWRQATGVDVRDGYGQTETGQLTANPPGRPPRPGSMGEPLPGVELAVVDGELVVEPASVPTFFTGYLGEQPPQGRWRTGDLVREEDGYLFFEGRADDVIISAGYRIGPFEVESVLVAHPAVAEAAVVAADDEERGAVVRAVVVLKEGFPARPELASELQEFVKRRTAPYKYPRVVDFVEELPKTNSGKVRRALLRGGRA